MVATSPIPSRTTSWDSLLKCGGGNQVRTDIPITAQPNVPANVMNAIAIATSG